MGPQPRQSHRRLPWSQQFPFVASPPVVALDLLDEPGAAAVLPRFTTVGNWRQAWRAVTFQGETDHWSKDLEFRKIIDLPLPRRPGDRAGV